MTEQENHAVELLANQLGVAFGIIVAYRAHCAVIPETYNAEVFAELNGMADNFIQVMREIIHPYTTDEDPGDEDGYGSGI
jgi:hypothetical protein